MNRITETVMAIKQVGISLFNLHFLAAFRLILSIVGVKRTYLVHCALMLGKGEYSPMTFAYAARPWITYYHLGEIENHAKAISGQPANVKSVTIINIVRIGNQ